jgi:hypothetical protein
MMKYYTKHPTDNAIVHTLAGIGIGFLLTYPVVGMHPVRFGVAFLALAVIGHLYAATQK